MALSFALVALTVVAGAALSIARGLLSRSSIAHSTTEKSKQHNGDLALLPRKKRSEEESENLVTWTLSGTYDEHMPVLVDAEQPQRFLTRNTATKLVEDLAGCFHPGNTVCLHLPNDIQYPVLFLAILASGCVWTGTNPAYTSAELIHHFRSSKVSVVITNQECLDTVLAAVEGCSDTVIEVVLFSDLVGKRECDHTVRGGDGQPLRTLEELLKANAGSRKMTLQQRAARLSANSVAGIMSTSGTTGLPKMIQRTHRSFVLESKGSDDNHHLKPYTVRRLYCTPIFHAFSFPEMVINSLRLGFPSFYKRRFDESFAQLVHRYDITETMAAPPMLLKLVTRSVTHDLEAHHLQSLRTVFCAGAALSTSVRGAFLQLFATPVRVTQVWGMSEGGWFATFPYPENDDSGSVGRMIAGYEVRLVETGKAASSPIDKKNDRGTASELWVRAPQLTCSYMDNQRATEETFDGAGWLRTGDVGFLEDGKVYLVDRTKDMIKVNGFSVSPAELEAALYRNFSISDAAVVGHGEGVDEHPVAFVVMKDATIATLPADITLHLQKFVARFKIAKCEVRFVQSIPRNASGKILRKTLRKQLLEELAPGGTG